MKEYTVYMTHKMRSIVIVPADSEEEAKEKAYKESFDNDGLWEEQDTKFDKIEEGIELEEEDD